MAKAMVAGALCLMLAACATLGDRSMKRKVEVIAHRGASAYAPENTMAAFRLAAEMRADWFELDCHLTKDGHVVVIHDNSVDRTTNGTGRVASMTLQEIKALDAGSWKDAAFAGESVPTLGEALDFARGRIGVYIELKNVADDSALMTRILELARDTPVLASRQRNEVTRLIEEDGTANLELTRKAIELIRLRRMQQQVVIQSFSPVICAVALVEAPEIRTEYLGSAPPDRPDRWEEFLRWMALLDPPGCNLGRDGLTLGRLGVFKTAGKSAAVWTVNDPDEMRQFATWGVDAIITDRPDVCLDVLRELGRR